MTPRYPLSMTQSQAMFRGMARGAKMATLPSPRHLRELRKVESSHRRTERAWNRAGQALSDSMTKTKR